MSNIKTFYDLINFANSQNKKIFAKKMKLMRWKHPLKTFAKKFFRT